MKALMLGNEAIARGAWEAGAVFGTGYPGTPSTEVLESMLDLEGVRVQWAPNEKVAYEVAVGASLAGVRAIVTMKHVGLNVAADPFFSSSYLGVGGGLVVVSADDPGMHSSQDEQDNRLLAHAAKVVMVEPADAAEARWMTREAFELSERFDTPILLRVTTRVCHQTALVQTDHREEFKGLGYRKDIAKHVLLPVNARQRRVAVEERLKAAEAFGNESDRWNPIIRKSDKVGVITSGVSYGYVREVVPDASILKIGLTHPLPMGRIREFAKSVKKLYVVEELEPYLEDALRAAGIKVHGGKALRSFTGELDLGKVEQMLLGKRRVTPTIDLSDVAIPARPPTLCPGCGHRGMFTLFRELKLRVMGDIGCYTLGALKPLASMEACMCMGASIGMAQGFARFNDDGRTIAVLGDSTFFHSGIPALIDMVVQGSRATVVIVDNSWTAMTGAQPNPSTGIDAHGQPAPRFDVAGVCRALGVKRVVEVDPYELEATRAVLEAELAADELSVVVAVKPCVLADKTPRELPMEVHTEDCNRCGSCIRVGCMGMHEKGGLPEVDPSLCTGCTICMQLCESGAIHRSEVTC